MSLNKRLIDASAAAPLPPDPVGVPVSASYVGYGTYPKNAGILHFTWDGLNVVDRKFEPISVDDDRAIGYEMSVPYDITTLSSSVGFDIRTSTSSGYLNGLTRNIANTQGLIWDYYFVRPMGGGSAFFDENVPQYTRQNIYIHDSGRYMIGNFSYPGVQEIFRREYPLADYDNIHAIASTTYTKWNIASLVPSGGNADIPLSVSVINQGNNFVLFDTVNSLFKIYSLATPYDFTSWSFVRDISIPTSDTTLVGTESRIFIHSMAGYFYAVREGSNRVHQFQWSF